MERTKADQSQTHQDRMFIKYQSQFGETQAAKLFRSKPKRASKKRKIKKVNVSLRGNIERFCSVSIG